MLYIGAGGNETSLGDVLSPDLQMHNAEDLCDIEATKTIRRAHRMAELDEVFGELHSIEKSDGWIIALIGKIPVFLPEEMAPKLKRLLRQRVRVLRCNGYKLSML